jgi:arabinose-5-phosphate isomerase
MNNKYAITDFLKKELVQHIDNYNIDEIKQLANIMKECMKTNVIYITGVGKSGYIADYICGILQSINIQIHRIDLLNATHGDIGVCKKDDMLLFLSKSGNTSEFVNKLHSFKSKSIKIVGICSNPDAEIRKHCDYNILLPIVNEYPGIIPMIPTSSIIAQVIFGIILCDELTQITGFTLDEYKLNHPSGDIGNKNVCISDIMYKKGEFPIISIDDAVNNVRISDVTKSMIIFKMGFCIITNMLDEVLGIITDGDLRRKYLLSKLEIISVNELCADYYYETDTTKHISELRSVQFIPVINDKKIIGLVKQI